MRRKHPRKRTTPGCFTPWHSSGERKLKYRRGESQSRKRIGGDLCHRKSKRVMCAVANPTCEVTGLRSAKGDQAAPLFDGPVDCWKGPPLTAILEQCQFGTSTTGL